MVLLVGREDVDDAVDGRRCTVRVQCAHHEHAHLGGRHRDAHRLEVAELADEDRVGVLAQGGVQRVRERRAVHADFALAHQAQLALMHELDRVLDREDVAFQLAVDRVDDACERRRLAGAGFARDEDQAARRRRELVQDFRHLELVERERLRGDASEHCADAVEVSEDVHAKARDVGDRVREVGGVVHVELMKRCLAHDAEELGLQLLGIEAVVVERDQVSVHAHTRRIARDHVEVGALAHVHASQEIVDQ